MLDDSEQDKNFRGDSSLDFVVGFDATSDVDVKILYDWVYTNKLTTMSTLENANPD